MRRATPRNGHVATVRLLIDAGACQDVEDNDGQTAAFYFGRFCFNHMDTVFP